MLLWLEKCGRNGEKRQQATATKRKAINCIACGDTHQPAPGSLTPSGGQKSLAQVLCRPSDDRLHQLQATATQWKAIICTTFNDKDQSTPGSLTLESFAVRLMIGFITYRAIGAPLGNNPSCVPAP
jgi:hypothetical protein